VNSGWVACAEPERPVDAYVLWHYEGCNACLLKAQMQQRLYPDGLGVDWLVNLMERNRGAA
jgi:hypothetical protein